MKFNVKKYIKFDFRIADILLVIGISLVIILLKLYGINEIPENSLVENIQVIFWLLLRFIAFIRDGKILNTRQ